MLDGIMVANKVVHAAKTCWIPPFALKIDYEKTYDSVSWEFLEYMHTVRVYREMEKVDRCQPKICNSLCIDKWKPNRSVLHEDNLDKGIC